MKQIRFGSLFAGIGGFDLGFERAGMECAWQVEIDDYCNKVLAKHWPGVKRYGDIRTVGKQELEPVDLICGGFPCQPYSVAGKRRGAEDDRNLWPEYLRIVRELRPTWVVGENVPGIIPMYLDTVLSDLEGEAYSCWTFNIPAIAFDAPHVRERIFVVAHRIGTVGRGGGVIREGNRQGWKRTQTERESLQPGNGKAYSGELEQSGEVVAYADEKREPGLPKREEAQITSVGISGANVCHATSQGLPDWINKEMGGSAERNTFQQPQRSDWWTVEPRVGRVADGVPARVDRLRSLGNAVVPQVAEFIGKQIYDTINIEFVK